MSLFLNFTTGQRHFLQMVYETLSAVDPGFEAKGLYVVEVRLSRERHPVDLNDSATWGDNHRIVRRILEEVRQKPGLAKTSLGMVHPMTLGWMTKYSIVGRPGEPGKQEIQLLAVADEYFETADISILSGRSFRATDALDSPPVAILNKAAVRQLFDEKDPIGRTVNVWYFDREIVGVVGDTHFRGIEYDALPAIYIPYFQSPTGFFILLTRTSLGPEALRIGVTRFRFNRMG